MDNKENIIEGNRLIAEFDGYKFEYHDVFGNPCLEPYLWKEGMWTRIGSLKYHSSWDWLIPCINKITSMKEYWSKYIDYTSSIVSEGGIYINTQFIENTWQEVVDFIQWYNSQKEENG